MNRDIPTDKTRNRVKNPALGANRKFGSVKGIVVAVGGCGVVGCGVVGMYLIQFKLPGLIQICFNLGRTISVIKFVYGSTSGYIACRW